MRLIVFVGASGSGKTSLAQRLEQKGFFCIYFDSIMGHEAFEVPPQAPPERWQELATHQWCRTIAREHSERELIFFDAQTRWSFVQGGCTAAGLPAAQLILIDCEDGERRQRLVGRGQAELANETMMEWAKWLRREATAKGYPILDTSGRSLEDSEADLIGKIRESLA